MRILKNQIKCRKCGEIIISEHVHDFKWCSCNSVAVDGGNEYLRRCAKDFDDVIELSECDENE